MPPDGKNLVCLWVVLANTAWAKICEGSGALEPDTAWKSMAGDHEE